MDGPRRQRALSHVYVDSDVVMDATGLALKKIPQSTLMVLLGGTQERGEIYVSGLQPILTPDRARAVRAVYKGANEACDRVGIVCFTTDYLPFKAENYRKRVADELANLRADFSTPVVLTINPRYLESNHLEMRAFTCSDSLEWAEAPCSLSSNLILQALYRSLLVHPGTSSRMDVLAPLSLYEMVDTDVRMLLRAARDSERYQTAKALLESALGVEQRKLDELRQACEIVGHAR